MKKVAVGISAQLRRKQGYADLRSPAQAHDGRNEQRDAGRPEDARYRERLHLLNSSPRFSSGEEIGDLVDASSVAILRQALEENTAVALASDAVVEEHQHAAIVK